MNTKDKKGKTGSEEKNSGRRKLLKSVVAGGGAATVAKLLPDQWARPVVDAIVLPSHAQTSSAALGPFVSSAITMADPEVQLADQGFSEELLEFFTPSAHATPVVNSYSMTVNDTGNSQLCADATYGNVTTEMISFPVVNEAFTSSECLFGNQIQRGSFDGTRWNISVLPPDSNTTTVVQLDRGGAGCSSGDPGSCFDL